MTDQEFLHAFDAGQLDPGAFPHADHVRAAWLCLRDVPFRDGVARLRRGLKQLTIRAGQPGRYHETVTVAYARLIHQKMRQLGPHAYGEFERRAPEFYAVGTNVLEELYDAATLASDEARQQFVAPPSWNSRVVDRFLQDFARYQAAAEARHPEGLLPEMAEPDARGAEPVSAMAVLAVTSVDASIAWYARVFGFDATPYPERPPYRLALLSRGGAELMLRQATGPVEAPAGWSLYVRLAGGRIRDLHAELASAAADGVSPLRRMPYRDVEFDVRDPDGYTIVVSELLDDAHDVPGVDAAEPV